MAAAFFHFTIDREALPWLDQHQVTEPQLGNCNVFFMAIDHPHCTLWAQRFEGPYGAGGLAFGPAFQVLAQQHQGDHHRRCLEVQVRGHPGRGLGPLVQATTVTGTGAQRDQQVHVAGAGAHSLVGRHIKACAKDELHGGGQRELRPGRQHPVQTKRLKQHRQHQGQGQQKGSADGQTFVAQAALDGFLVIVDRQRQAGTVAGLFDRAEQQVVINALQHLKVGTFVGKVDTDLFNAR
ncbi:hypothetical protein D3C79_673240 [compost metagenome]